MKILFLLMLLIATSPCRAESEITVDKSDDGVMHVSALVSIPAPENVVWQTLTDYEHLAMFVPDMTVSRVISAPGKPLRVEQQGSTNFLLFSFPIKVVFAIEIPSARELRFRAIEGNLHDMTGTYQLEPTSTGTRIHYETRFRPDFWVPPFVSAGIIQREIERQFDGLAQEIVRRNTNLELQSH